VLAALAALHAVDNGYQAALMAPTEILAEQHFRKLAVAVERLGVRTTWLTGSLKRAAKRSAQDELDSGNSQLAIGTHALIQEGVTFRKLGLAIVDEQHRFGVGQRLALRAKLAEGQPHQLMMSATPIPRTLAMTYYADLEVSTIDEMPPGRKPVVTRVFADSRRDEVLARIEEAIGAGRQAYWVCPLIEESEALQLQTAVDTHAALSAALPQLRVGLVHGRLAAAEKAAVMAEFAAGAMPVLVATTVIEVGVDVANASLMVIEHAERFGLAQLHQLRGRIGRGSAESVCILLYQTPLSASALGLPPPPRAAPPPPPLSIMRETTDGFEIARRDLELRGPGEFLGHRQSGAALLRFADLVADQDLVVLAQDAADRLLRDDGDAAERHLARWMAGREEFLKT
jgi:ATP-dependent DNA helicase RecG